MEAVYGLKSNWKLHNTRRPPTCWIGGLCCGPSNDNHARFVSITPQSSGNSFFNVSGSGAFVSMLTMTREDSEMRKAG